MADYNMYDRILGSLITSGVGGALGAAVESFSPDEIRRQFGRVTGFVDPSFNEVTFDNRVGEIADDTSQLIEITRMVIEKKGALTPQDAAQALINWSENWPRYYPSRAGKTTAYAVPVLKQGKDPEEVAMFGKHWGRGETNGAAARVAAAGLINPGNLDGAVETAIAIVSPSHGTQHGYAGACAIACAVAEAMTENADVWSVLKAAFWGAQRGHEIGLAETRDALGPTVVGRSSRAVAAALVSGDICEAEDKINRLMGDETFNVQSAVAVALAMFAAADGDTMKTLEACVNFGGDADTLACVGGMIAGALNGSAALDPKLRQEFEEANPDVDLEALAKGLFAIAMDRKV